ncbi:AAA family ATPase [Rathayibacter tanaceti]|uniref:AAA family ATPase n=1 Tax=Rathayibacter tanaceti TaxID=1671680 RepID=A0AAE6RM01_9MICO|nr:AAA family ATPase [Rathayibacter tanaceti]
MIDGGETLVVEFTRGTRALNDDAIVEAVTCLANGAGGTLLLGVEDDGRVTGLAPRHGEATQPHLLQAMILNRTDPPVATGVEIIVTEGHPVAVIEVPDLEAPVGTSSGKYVRRRLDARGEPECTPYPLHEMMSAGLSAQGRDYAATVARGATWDDIDSAELDRFRALCGTGRGDAALSAATDADILRALRLMQPSHDLTLGAILLFGTAEALERFVPTAETVFTHFSGRAITSSETLRRPLLQTAAHLQELIASRNSEQEVVVGLHRVGVRRVPDIVIRETIANALVHRDYSLLGPVTVELDDLAFRVVSPGGFPSGITLDNLLDDSRPRSPILADAFKRAGIVDRAGRGIREIFEQVLRAGRGEPDYSRSTSSSVVVSVPTSDTDIETVRFILEFEDSTRTTLTLLQLRLLHELKATGPQSVGELVAGLSEVEAKVRSQLTRLAELGLTEARGTGRNRRNHLTAAFYRLAESSEYVRLQDTDPLQQERLIVSYAEHYGRITRSKAAELCRLSPEQARVVLRRLVVSGALELRGERRTAHYVVPSEDPA